MSLYTPTQHTKPPFMPKLWHTVYTMHGYTRGSIIPATLIAGVLVAFLSGVSYLLVANDTTSPIASITLSPSAAVANIDGTFTVTVQIESQVPVNVFMGNVHFDGSKLVVDKIDYNTSIADLWAEEPWYKNGDGTINFAGGTTVSGGFVGKGDLLTITFRTIAAGDAAVWFVDAAILEHNGLGTAVDLGHLATGQYTVIANANTLGLSRSKSAITVRTNSLRGDVNDDGLVTIADVSQILLYLTTGNSAGDLNDDGRVSLTDVSIVMGAM